MITILIKLTFYFTLSFLVLSIPLENNTIFSQLNKITSPYTAPVFAQIKLALNKGVDDGTTFAKRIFSNSSPKTSLLEELKKRQDSVSLGISSWQKKEHIFEDNSKQEIIADFTKKNTRSKKKQIRKKRVEHYSEDDIKQFKAIFTN